MKVQAQLWKVQTNEEEIMIYVQLFEKFQMSDQKHILDEKTMHSDMLIKLLAYLMIHRRNASTIQELIDIFWGDERSENPAGALKNLMYRLRTILKKTWGDKEFILTGRGSYQWNPHIPLELDTELFEEYCRDAFDMSDRDKKIEIEKRQPSFTQGDFFLILQMNIGF